MNLLKRLFGRSNESVLRSRHIGNYDVERRAKTLTKEAEREIEKYDLNVKSLKIQIKELNKKKNEVYRRKDRIENSLTDLNFSTNGPTLSKQYREIRKNIEDTIGIRKNPVSDGDIRKMKYEGQFDSIGYNCQNRNMDKKREVLDVITLGLTKEMSDDEIKNMWVVAGCYRGNGEKRLVNRSYTLDEYVNEVKNFARTVRETIDQHLEGFLSSKIKKKRLGELYKLPNEESDNRFLEIRDLERFISIFDNNEILTNAAWLEKVSYQMEERADEFRKKQLVPEVKEETKSGESLSDEERYQNKLREMSERTKRQKELEKQGFNYTVLDELGVLNREVSDKLEFRSKPVYGPVTGFIFGGSRGPAG